MTQSEWNDADGAVLVAVFADAARATASIASPSR